MKSNFFKFRTGTIPGMAQDPSPFGMPPDPAPSAATPDLQRLSADARTALHAWTVGAVARPRAWIHSLLQTAGRRTSEDRPWTAEKVRAALDTLAAEGWLIEHPQRVGYWRVHPGLYTAACLDALDHGRHLSWLHALVDLEKVADGGGRSRWWQFPNLDAAVAVTRWKVFGGCPPEDLTTLKAACGWGMGWDNVLERALHDPLDEALFIRLHPGLQAEVLADRLGVILKSWSNPGGLPVPALTADWHRRWLHQPDFPRSAHDAVLIARWAEHQALAGDFDAAEQTLATLPTGAATAAAATAASTRPSDDPERFEARLTPEALQGLQAFQSGQWTGSTAHFEAELSALLTATGRRKGLLPPHALLTHVLALMAQPQGEALQQALKRCSTESGKRQPPTDTPWGVLAAALQMRLGDSRRDVSPFLPTSRPPHLMPLDFWRWMARAWLHDTSAGAAPLGEDALKAADFLRHRLLQCGLNTLAAQMDAALAVLQGREAPTPFFAARRSEGWRQALAALASLGETPTPRSNAVVQAEERLLWVLALDESGRLLRITPMEQKRGVRGWSRPKEVPLSRLLKAGDLPTRDAAVARCIRTSTRDRHTAIDRAAAIAALVGHPHVTLEELPEVALTLSEGAPELDVHEDGDQLVLRLDPLPPGLSDPGSASDDLLGRAYSHDPNALKEAEVLRALMVRRAGPQELQLVRLTPEQRRAAQLIGTGLTVPKSAAEELRPVLERLGAHFRIHTDDPLAHAREVPAEPRLRAELTPQGDGLRLRLVVTPLGPQGPRLNPGQGRAQVVATVEGEALSAQRRLDAERDHLDTVMDACPMLAPLPARAPAAWDIENPQDALSLLERLHTLNAVQGLDWPQGKAIRVDTVGIGQVHVNVKSRAQWLALEGGVVLHEQLVASLERLLDWGAHQKSRFVPLGEGRYLALTEELRQRLEDLATVAQPGRATATSTVTGTGSSSGPETGAGAKDSLNAVPLTRLPAVAAAWLDRTLAGADVQADPALRLRLDRLAEIQQFEPEVPGTLQARLRPYQEDGYQWAMRLAECGFGACLADDMGLGKTLQALAVLLARGAEGPALVVAPTSLIGNWQAEARRFAPSLRVRAYGEADTGGDRDDLVRSAGVRDVVLVSYQMMLNNAAAFTDRTWHTLVLDEAQAIKNAAAKRSRTVFDLEAGFTLALSGTPVENRLAELWSIMRACNPGLLGSLQLFNLRFAVPIERDRNKGAQRVLRTLIAPFVLRRTKAQVLDDLPPRTELTMVVEGDETERAHYEALRRQAVRDAERAMKSDAPGQAHLNILAQLTKLRRAACDPRLITPELKTSGAKVQAFAQLAAELTANGHKALVFSQFVDFLGLLREPLDTAGIRYQYLDGSTPAAERSKRVAAFQAGEGDLFLISLKAGGFGLNLTVADYVVIADPWWNPAAEDQASGRAHRIGQQRPVTVYRLVNKGTLEEKIVALHQDKRELADSVLEGHDVTSPLPAEELVALMLGDKPGN